MFVMLKRDDANWLFLSVGDTAEADNRGNHSTKDPSVINPSITAIIFLPVDQIQPPEEAEVGVGGSCGGRGGVGCCGGLGGTFLFFLLPLRFDFFPIDS